jgi:Na+/melibiose symporter-like transporter
MLSKLSQHHGAGADAAQAHGLYFGWWNLVAKLNLALAAGLALPLLTWLGYAPGSRDPAALHSLAVVYCLLPCLVKAAAAGALYFFFIQPSERDHHAS